MSKIRVLIADDSRLIQEVLSSILSSNEELEVVGVAENGQEALDKVKRLTPDIVTIDIRMPVMDGLEAIQHIMSECAIPILVISDVSESSAAFTALSNGALDVIAKSYIHEEKAAELIQKVKILAKVKVIRHIRRKPKTQIIRPFVFTGIQEHEFANVVAIACSTGGPSALSTILKGLPENFPFPIVIAQHIEDGFIDGLVEWINSISKLRVKKAEDGDLVKTGHVFISPTNKNLVISKGGRVILQPHEPDEIYHPSCNKLLSTAGSIFKEKCIGLILSGMGSDGVEGIKEIKKNGGVTIAQDKASSVVFGMPNEAIKSGSVDQVLPLTEIAKFLLKFVKQESQKRVT